ncbi:unnamed protein product [Symbiodinium sp. CCMP2456]|nr:unnamed protein product [Symbiodinium sp. CCMP2456]
MASGEELVTLSDDEFESLAILYGARTAFALKQHLVLVTGKTRFQQRLLENGSILPDDALLHLPLTVGLVFLSFCTLDTQCSTALEIAISQDDANCVDALLQEPFDPNAEGFRDFQFLSRAASANSVRSAKLLVEARAELSRPDADSGLAPLHHACVSGSVAITHWLIESGVDVARPAATERVPILPLELAIAGGNTEIARLLIQASASVNAVADRRLTPLGLACSVGQVGMARLLVEAGADVNYRHDCDTPLHAACTRGWLEVVRFLVEAGADKEVVGTEGPPLHAAITFGHTDTVRYLLEASASIEASPPIGRTPLVLACLVSQLDSVRLLTQHRACLDKADEGSFIPLHVACFMGDLEIVRALIQGRANLSIMADGVSAAEIAHSREFHDIASLLTDAARGSNERHTKRRRRIKGPP